MRTPPRIPPLVVALALLALAGEARGQGGTYGGGVVAPGSPPLTLSGSSGGPRRAQTLGPDCRGAIAQRPDHVIMVTAPMSVRLEVTNTAGDTTMVLVGPSGVLCDDNSGEGQNPRITSPMLPGQYQVYIGTRSGPGLVPYTLQVQGFGAAAPAPPPTPAGALFGGAMVGPRQQSARLTGTSGGPVLARTLGPRCAGYITAAAGHTLTVTAPMVMTFEVVAGGDTTLVITGPGGTTCDDDSGQGFNPRITRPLAQGTYQIFVGSYSRGQQQQPYTLRVHP